jgi:hypothetical protein
MMVPTKEYLRKNYGLSRRQAVKVLEFQAKGKSLAEALKAMAASDPRPIAGAAPLHHSDKR